VTKMIK